MDRNPKPEMVRREDDLVRLVMGAALLDGEDGATHEEDALTAWVWFGGKVWEWDKATEQWTGRYRHVPKRSGDG